MLNGLVGYQILDDGTFGSIFLILGSTACILVGTGFIVMDTGYDWTGYFSAAITQNDPNRSYAIYTLYFLAPLFFMFVYFVLEAWLVVRILGELKPLCKACCCNYGGLPH